MHFSLFRFRSLVLLGQFYGSVNPIAPSPAGCIVTATIVRDLCLRLLIGKKSIVPVPFPRIGITQLNQQFDPLSLQKGLLRCRNGRGFRIRLS